MGIFVRSSHLDFAAPVFGIKAKRQFSQPEVEATKNVPKTITGSNEAKAPEMPAAAGGNPAPEQSPADDLSFRPGENKNDLTGDKIQQSMSGAINEKHASIDESGIERTADVVRQQAESAFGEVRKRAGAVLEGTAFDPGFYETAAGQWLQKVAADIKPISGQIK